jgi:hypothetical protein
MQGEGKKSHKTGESIVPEKLQEVVPEGVEKALPDSIHDTSVGIHTSLRTRRPCSCAFRRRIEDHLDWWHRGGRMSDEILVIEGRNDMKQGVACALLGHHCSPDRRGHSRTSKASNDEETTADPARHDPSIHFSFFIHPAVQTPC